PRDPAPCTRRRGRGLRGSTGARPGACRERGSPRRGGAWKNQESSTGLRGRNATGPQKRGQRVDRVLPRVQEAFDPRLPEACLPCTGSSGEEKLPGAGLAEGPGGLLGQGLV